MTKKTTNIGENVLNFLMTYGWAIMLAFVVLGGLVYFGTLNLPFSKFNPELHECIEWECSDTKFGIGLSSVSYNKEECYYAIQEEFRVAGNNTLIRNGELIFKGVCSLWKKKVSEQSFKETNESTYDCWTICDSCEEKYGRGYLKTLIYNGKTIITDNANGKFGVREICEFQRNINPIVNYESKSYPSINVTRYLIDEDFSCSNNKSINDSKCDKTIYKRTSICPKNTFYQFVTCECAKNTSTPCMATCFNCVEDVLK